jgi:hypothetical protein
VDEDDTEDKKDDEAEVVPVIPPLVVTHTTLELSEKVDDAGGDKEIKADGTEDASREQVMLLLLVTSEGLICLNDCPCSTNCLIMRVMT